MKKPIFVIMLIMTLHVVNGQTINDIDRVFNTKFEYKMISRGNNFPDFYIDQDSMNFLLFALHENIPIDDFKKKTNFNDDKLDKITSFLISKNWLHKVGSLYKPTIFIANVNDGKALYEYAVPISNDIVASIRNSLPEIKYLFAKTNISTSQSFEEWSFLILSNILLDSWQINDVEKYFLKKDERPFRHGKYYYQTIMEHTETDKESFGIYGNQMSSNDGKTMSVYGNNRRANTEQALSYHTVSSHDDEIFSKMASSFLPDLLQVLENHRLYSEATFKELGYSNEITFEEFFIWWYHFIYTQATNKMEQEGLLQIPENGNFYYERID